MLSLDSIKDMKPSEFREHIKEIQNRQRLLGMEYENGKVGFISSGNNYIFDINTNTLTVEIEGSTHVIVPGCWVGRTEIYYNHIYMENISIKIEGGHSTVDLKLNLYGKQDSGRGKLVQIDLGDSVAAISNDNEYYRYRLNVVGGNSTKWRTVEKGMSSYKTILAIGKKDILVGGMGFNTKIKVTDGGVEYVFTMFIRYICSIWDKISKYNEIYPEIDIDSITGVQLLAIYDDSIEFLLDILGEDNIKFKLPHEWVDVNVDRFMNIYHKRSLHITEIISNVLEAE